ncbi:MAG: HlyD family efflux transporter periplasmic adaptor subunit [Hyphomicrobiaceae bacterium]|nr:HlyD family efflux transporter periplasmic adaptor subunit [Hyphomicrobiaceae bacterium]
MIWKTGAFLLVAALAAAAGFFVWQNNKPPELPSGFTSSNGRLEVQRTDIAAKFPGRIKEIRVREGDTVEAGQVLVVMDTAELEAQLLEANAAVLESEQLLDQAVALLAQRKTDVALANKEYKRSYALGKKGYTPRETVDQRRAALATAKAAERSASAGIKRAKAGITAAKARAKRLEENLKDYVLLAPRDGRIQYRLAQQGEVVGAGGKVLTLLDLSDVYMTIFLPTKDIGRLEIGAQARIVPDAAAQYVIPANVSFVASDAQFTPKYVETRTEREKLMFRVKVRLPQEVLKRYAKRVKAGVTGMAYVRLSPEAKWPDYLQVKLPSVQTPAKGAEK